MSKKCPLQTRYYIPPKALAPEYRDCPFISYCPLPWCILDVPGSTSQKEMDALKDPNLPLGCPKCQADITTADKIRVGITQSGLEPHEDGLICRHCGLILYKDKPIKKKVGRGSR
jgi:hypothetical protein